MEQPEDLLNNLEQIGLTDKQARVYLALLSLESPTAYEIAQHCEVKKPTVYVILEELRQKGLVLKVPHAKKALFAARDLGEYIDEQKRKVRSVEEMLPAFLSLPKKGKPAVYFFTGIKGIREAMQHKLESMRGKTFQSCYSNLADGSKEIMDVYTEWNEQAVNTDVSFDIVMAKKDAQKYYKGVFDWAERNPKHARIKLLEESPYPSTASIEIGSDFVRFINEKDLQATVIDDVAIAEAMRHIFDIVWNKGK
mgnify:CR=1 FL=1